MWKSFTLSSVHNISVSQWGSNSVYGSTLIFTTYVLQSEENFTQLENNVVSFKATSVLAHLGNALRYSS